VNKEFEIINVNTNNKNDWDKALEGITTSVYFSWEYIASISLNYDSGVNLIKISNSDSGVILIITTRTKDNYVFDAYSPYALDGIYFWGKDFDIIHKKLIEYLKENRIITYYLISHPGFQSTVSKIFQEHRTIYQLKIDKELEDLWKGFHPNHRYEINKFAKINHEIIDNKSLLIEPLIDLYQKTTSRVNASSTYLFSKKTLRDLNQSEITYIIGVKINGTIECVVIFLYGSNWAEYFINASSDIGRQATRTLIWEGIKRLKFKGITNLNLGGGINENDPLDQFKRRFGAQSQKLLLMKGITSKYEYERLCKQYNILSDNNNYFPPYWSK
jgi:hypothetical protein